MKKTSMVLKSLFIGSILLYIYNYVYYKREYKVLTKEVYNSLNIFLGIAICSLILIVIIYVVNNMSKKTLNIQQISFDLEKKQYEIPKEKQTSCSNCNNVIDKNAFICLYCGTLLRQKRQDYTNITLLLLIIIVSGFIYSYNKEIKTENNSISFYDKTQEIIKVFKK